MFANYTSDKRLTTRKYRELKKKKNSPKLNDPMKKWAKELNSFPCRAFSKEEAQMAKKTHEEMLTSLMIKEMQIK
jgi:hypothetical protein